MKSMLKFYLHVAATVEGIAKYSFKLHLILA